MRQRIRSKLEMHDERARQGLARRARARRVDALDVHGRAVAGSHPEPSPFPARIRIVDAAVDALGEEAHGVGDPQLDDLPIRQDVEWAGEVAGTDRRVRAEAQDVVLVDPRVVGALGRAVAAGERGPWNWIERPAFRTQISFRRARPVEAPLALATIEAGDVTARQRHPRHTLAIDVEAAHTVARRRHSVDLR